MKILHLAIELKDGMSLKDTLEIFAEDAKDLIESMGDRANCTILKLKKK